MRARVLQHDPGRPDRLPHPDREHPCPRGLALPLGLRFPFGFSLCIALGFRLPFTLFVAFPLGFVFPFALFVACRQYVNYLLAPLMMAMMLTSPITIISSSHRPLRGDQPLQGRERLLPGSDQRRRCLQER